MELQQQLTELITEQKVFVQKSNEEFKSLGTVTNETKTALTKLQTQVDAIDAQLAHRHTQQAPLSDFKKKFEENDGVQRILREKKGRAYIDLTGDEVAALVERKTVITELVSGSIGTDTGNPVGVATTGVLPIDRISGITAEPRYQLRVRDVLPARPTTAPLIDFVKVSSPMAIASPVAEGSLKPENSVSFAAASERVKTLATWIPATNQVLQDMPELMGYLQAALPYYVNKMEDLQFLSGDGTGENLHGIIPQSTSFTTSLLTASAGYSRLDMVGEAINQINLAAELDPTFVILNTADWWKLRLTKDGFGRYILGDPQNGLTRPTIWGLDLVPTNAIAQGTFVVGNGTLAAIEIRDRMGMTVEISTETNDFFLRNMVAIRAEKRVALIVKRPGSFVTGTLASSPVS